MQKDKKRACRILIIGVLKDKIRKIIMVIVVFLVSGCSHTLNLSYDSYDTNLRDGCLFTVKDSRPNPGYLYGKGSNVLVRMEIKPNLDYAIQSAVCSNDSILAIPVNPASESAAKLPPFSDNRPLIPFHSCHPIRRKPATWWLKDEMAAILSQLIYVSPPHNSQCAERIAPNNHASRILLDAH